MGDPQEKKPGLGRNRGPRQAALVWPRSGQEAEKRKLQDDRSKERLARSLGMEHLGPHRLPSASRFHSGDNVTGQWQKG